MKDQETNEVSRREVIGGALALMLASGPLSMLASGCGGGGGLVAGGTGSIRGRLHPEISGTGLVVLTSVADSTALGGSRSFTIDAPLDAGPILVIDSSGALAGAAMSPGASSIAGDLEISAESTLLFFLLLSPGVGSPIPAEHAAVVERIRRLPEFHTAVAFLRSKLAMNSMTQALQQADVAARMLACAEALEAQPPAPDIVADEAEHGISLKVKDPKSATTDITYSNGGFRYVKVRRRDSDVSAATVAVSLVGVWANGATNLSYSSLFTLGVGDPTSFEDKTLNFGNFASAEYIFEGIGFASSLEEPLPPGVTDEAAVVANLLTVLEYAVFPLLDTLLGTKLLGQYKKAERAVQEFVKRKDVVDLMLEINEAESWSDAVTRMIDLLLLALDYIADSPILQSILAISGNRLSLLKRIIPILTLGSALFGVFNLVRAGIYFASVPRRHIMSVSATGNGVIVVT